MRAVGFGDDDSEWNRWDPLRRLDENSLELAGSNRAAGLAGWCDDE